VSPIAPLGGAEAGVAAAAAAAAVAAPAAGEEQGTGESAAAAAEAAAAADEHGGAEAAEEPQEKAEAESNEEDSKSWFAPPTDKSGRDRAQVGTQVITHALLASHPCSALLASHHHIVYPAMVRSSNATVLFLTDAGAEADGGGCGPAVQPQPAARDDNLRRAS